MDNEIILYQSDNSIQLDVRLENESVWLTLSQMSLLLDRDKSVISRHIKNIFGEHELIENSVVAKNATTASDGKVYLMDFYNLDAILSIGYRVNSINATKFRIWANSVLKDYSQKWQKFSTKMKHR